MNRAELFYQPTDFGAKKLEIKPPNGMEFKRWD
jgi:hypothetical protein